MMERIPPVERSAAVLDTVATARRLVSVSPITRSALREVEGVLKRLAVQAELFGGDEFPAAKQGDSALYQLYVEPEDGLALYLNVLNPRKSSMPHNHTTWAVIAAIQGDELNRIYRRLDDGSQPGRASLELDREVVVTPGTSVSFLPDEIHSIHGAGDRTIRHLHLYGRPLHSLTGRLGFDPAAGTVSNYNSLYMTPAIVAA